MENKEQRLINLAIARIGAVPIGGGEYAYYAEETSSYWVVDTQDMLDLGTLLDDGTPDAYSLWCADTMGQEKPSGWSPDDDGDDDGDDDVTIESRKILESFKPCSSGLRMLDSLSEPNRNRIYRAILSCVQDRTEAAYDELENAHIDVGMRLEGSWLVDRLREMTEPPSPERTEP